MSETLKQRSEMDPKYEWNLTTLFKDDDAFEQSLKDMDEAIVKAASYQGTLHTAQGIKEFYDFEVETGRHLSDLFCYASLRHSEDTRDAKAQSMYSRSYSKLVQFESALAYAQPEILTLDQEALKDICNDPLVEEYKFALEDLCRNKAHTLSEKEEKEYKSYLESIGDSIVVVADDEVVKTHVHTNDPGLAIQKALTHGSLTKIKIDNMREEHQEKLIKDAEKAAAQQKEQEAEKEEPRKPMGFIAVSIGEGMNEIFRGLGADYLIEGGQTMNPSTEDMLAAIDHVNADHIFILPNNKNIIMAANQAAELTEDKDIIVLPTKTIPQGIVALVNYIPDYTAEENKEAMLAELDSVKTGQVTYAVRDTEIDGMQIRQNDYMGIGDKAILAVGTDLKETTMKMIDAMVDEDSAIVSIYYGADETEEHAQEIGKMIEEKYPDVEVEINCGGQPIYYFVISVE